MVEPFGPFPSFVSSPLFPPKTAVQFSVPRADERLVPLFLLKLLVFSRGTQVSTSFHAFVPFPFSLSEGSGPSVSSAVSTRFRDTAATFGFPSSWWCLFLKSVTFLRDSNTWTSLRMRRTFLSMRPLLTFAVPSFLNSIEKRGVHCALEGAPFLPVYDASSAPGILREIGFSMEHLTVQLSLEIFTFLSSKLFFDAVDSLRGAELKSKAP